MGEAKRKRAALAAAPCRCGTGLPAGTCCFDGRTTWNKRPAGITLATTGAMGTHGKCYLRDLNSCSDKITGEHYVSHAALRVLAEQKIDVSGFPWMKNGESKVLSFESLTANCLCAAHNSALSPLDEVAGRFFAAVKECGTDDRPPNKHFLFSGYDLERWFLKTLAGLNASGNLAIQKERLTYGFHENINLGALLEHPSAWTKAAGLYLSGQKGQIIQRRDHFHMAPLTTIDENKLVGFTTNLQGFDFALLAMEPPTKAPVTGAAYRPGGIEFGYKNAKHVIDITWGDSSEHAKLTVEEDV